MKTINFRFSYACLLLLLAVFVHAEEVVITEGGREVSVQEDGSWEFVSQDQFASLPDGSRVRLKPDGSWVVDESLPRVSTSLLSAVQEEGAEVVFFSPLGLVIETSRERVGKNTRYRSETIFTLELGLPVSAQEVKQLNLNEETLSVKDSGGSQYPLLSITPSSINLAPGEFQEVEVRVEGSPDWRRGKHYDVVIGAELLQLRRDLEIEFPLSEAIDRSL